MHLPLAGAVLVSSNLSKMVWVKIVNTTRVKQTRYGVVSFTCSSPKPVHSLYHMDKYYSSQWIL